MQPLATNLQDTTQINLKKEKSCEDNGKYCIASFFCPRGKPGGLVGSDY